MHILIVDDHPMVLQSMMLILEQAGHQVDSAADERQAREKLQQRYDLLLLDYNLQTNKGTELLDQEIVRPDRTVLISGLTDPDIILHTLENPAVHAFISKQLDPEELPLAIAQLEQLSTPPPWIWCSQGKSFVGAGEAYPKNSVLTPKEREVFMLLRQGMLDKQIADHLHRSIHTIRVQIRAIKRKRGGQRRLPEA